MAEPVRISGITHFRNAPDFIPLTMIPLTELAVGNTIGRADLARRNQMMAEGAGKKPVRADIVVERQ